MLFLLRALFWLCIVILLLPGDPDRPTDAPSVTVLEVLVAARTAIADLSGMCQRNPELCVTGGEVAAVLAEKARYNIEQLTDYLGEGEANTLTADDLEVPWQEPVSEPVAYAAIGG